MNCRAFIAGLAYGLSWLAAAYAAEPAPDVVERRCIEPVRYLRLDPAQAGADDAGRAVLGSYERISPDGRFVLRSWSGARLGEVSLIELPAHADAPLVLRRTPLSNEAFPVQASWRYLVDVNGDHYRFADVVREQRGARPLFRGGMTGFYAVASELAPPAQRDPAAPILIRSLSWPQPSGVDAGGAQGSVVTAGSGALQLRTLRIEDDGRAARIVQDSGARYICSARTLADGNVYALPMLSVDGTEFSAVPQAPGDGQPSMRVYGLAREPFAAAQPCEQRLDLGYSPAKAVFGFAGAGAAASGGAEHAAPLVYTHDGSVYFFERDARGSGTAFLIDDLKTDVIASAFPGLTRDGRIVFGATWKDCAGSICTPGAGYVVADPYQSHAYQAHWAALGKPPAHGCITQAEAARERAAFAAWHRLPEPSSR